MVSKLIRKTPTKSIKDSRRNRCIGGSGGRSKRKSTTTTPVKSPTTSSVVIATINESFFTCRRRLVKIFSKIVKIATPKRSPRRQGFKRLKKQTINTDPGPEFQNHPLLVSNNNQKLFESNRFVRKPLFFGLPPVTESGKRTIFLDLDETLVHSKSDPPPEKFDFIVRPVIDGESMAFYVLKRPGVDEFLEFLAKKFEIVIFTAGLKAYASLVLDALDIKKVISYRLYRDSCKERDGRYVKDLSEMGRDLSKIVIVDDNPSSYAYQPENAIQIKPFVDDLGDEELKKLMMFIDEFDGFEDLRDAVKFYDPSGQHHGNQNVEW